MTPQPDVNAAWRLDLSSIDPAGPGLVAGIARGGELISLAMSGREGVGEASPRLTEHTQFYAASISKQFTAACLALLEAAGALRIDASVRRLVRGLPQAFEPVTLNHLVHHTSGVEAAHRLAAYTPDAWWSDADLADVIADLARTGQVVRVPGEAHSYANEGYWLLAAAIEQAAAQTLGELAVWRLLGPLGMASSRFRDRAEPMRPGVAVGHALQDGSPLPIHTRFRVVGDGGLLTTVADLARWDRLWSGTTPLGPDLPMRLQGQGVLNDGALLQYAWGVNLRRHRHLRILSHGGNFIGFNGKYVRFLDLDFAVIVLANTDAVDADAWAMRLADLALEGVADPDARTWAQTFAPDGRAEPDYETGARA
jgi:CubicO group peptidase (beta-lactamase class C family)